MKIDNSEIEKLKNHIIEEEVSDKLDEISEYKKGILDIAKEVIKSRKEIILLNRELKGEYFHLSNKYIENTFIYDEKTDIFNEGIYRNSEVGVFFNLSIRENELFWTLYKRKGINEEKFKKIYKRIEGMDFIRGLSDEEIYGDGVELTKDIFVCEISEPERIIREKAGKALEAMLNLSKEIFRAAGNWRSAVEEFLEPWKKEGFVLAAVATGSFVTGNNTDRSDIDLHIIFSDETDWRERGNKFIKGYLIEYFSNPAGQIYKYMDNGLRDGNRIDANMHNIGTVIFDKTGITNEIKKRAEEDLKKEYHSINSFDCEMLKYGIWDYFEEITERFENRAADYFYLYNIFLEKIAVDYSRYIKSALPSGYKRYRFFKDEEYRKRYNNGDYKDMEFAERYIKCVEERDFEKSYACINKLKNYVLEKMGGFDIDGWKLRAGLEL